MTSESCVSVDGIANHPAITPESAYRRIDGRGPPAHEVGRLWKLELTAVDDCVRAGGADAHEADYGPKPRGTR